MSTNFYSNLESYIETLLTEFDQISSDRQVQLQELANYIQDRLEKLQSIQLNFICTHNSRRSHISQIWASAAACYFGLKNIKCFSGSLVLNLLHNIIIKNAGDRKTLLF